MLLERLGVEPGMLCLDLGCGWGELLLRAVAAGSADGAFATGVGVDTDTAALDRGRAQALARGLQDQITFVEAAAAEWNETADRVLCVGASHAFGGTEQALTALTPLVRQGGRLLFADGCWERPPTGAAEALFGADVEPLADVLTHAVAAGWRVLHVSTADQREWDDFESTWRAGRQEWLVAHPSDGQTPAVRRELDAQLTEYVGTYRGVLGFCYLVLARENHEVERGVVVDHSVAGRRGEKSLFRSEQDVGAAQRKEGRNAD
jgi:ubiquinone/menaquinone biosynthesis C-methylase UbiE